MTTRSAKGVLAMIVGVVAGAAAATALVSIAYAQGYESFARGISMGAAGALIVLVALWLLGERAGGPGRIVSGAGDERDRTLETQASSDASVGMLVGAVGGVVAGLYGMPGPLVGGVVLWAGLIVGLTSYVVRSRRQ